MTQEEKKLPEGLEKAAEEYATKWHKRPDGSEWKSLFPKAAIRDFIAGAEWGMNQCPLPEDTTIFLKGVAEGRRLEREEQTGWKPTRLQFKALEVAGSFFASFKGQSDSMRMAWDTFHEPLESLGRDLKKML